MLFSMPSLRKNYILLQAQNLGMTKEILLLEGVDSAGAAWRSYSIRIYWNGMMKWWSGLFGGRNNCGCKETLQLVYSDVHGCSNQIIYATWRCRFQLGWSLIFLFRSLIVWWWKVNCLCKYYNVTIHMFPLKLLFFTSFLTQSLAIILNQNLLEWNDEMMIRVVWWEEQLWV